MARKHPAFEPKKGNRYLIYLLLYSIAIFFVLGVITAPCQPFILDATKPHFPCGTVSTLILELDQAFWISLFAISFVIAYFVTRGKKR